MLILSDATKKLATVLLLLVDTNFYFWHRLTDLQFKFSGVNTANETLMFAKPLKTEGAET